MAARALLLLLLTSALSPAQIFLDERQAAGLVLGSCPSVERRTKTLTAGDRTALEKLTGLRWPLHEYTFLLCRQGEAVKRYAVIMNEIGKSEPITFMVGVGPDGKCGEVALMVFRESRGAEVRERRFMRQFRGKSLKNPIRLNQDVLSYTGATLSSEAIARGVKKALALVRHYYLTK